MTLGVWILGSMLSSSFTINLMEWGPHPSINHQTAINITNLVWFIFLLFHLYLNAISWRNTVEINLGQWDFILFLIDHLTSIWGSCSSPRANDQKKGQWWVWRYRHHGAGPSQVDPPPVYKGWYENWPPGCEGILAHQTQCSKRTMGNGVSSFRYAHTPGFVWRFMPDSQWPYKNAGIVH